MASPRAIVATSSLGKHKTPQKASRGPATRARSASRSGAGTRAADIEEQFEQQRTPTYSDDNDGQDRHMRDSDAEERGHLSDLADKYGGDLATGVWMTFDAVQKLAGKMDKLGRDHENLRAYTVSEFTKANDRMDDMGARLQALERERRSGRRYPDWQLQVQLTEAKFAGRQLQLILVGVRMERDISPGLALNGILRDADLDGLPVSGARYTNEGPVRAIAFSVHHVAAKRALFAPPVRAFMRKNGLYVREEQTLDERNRRRDLFRHPLFQSAHQRELDKRVGERSIIWMFDTCFLGRGAEREAWNWARVQAADMGDETAAPKNPSPTPTAARPTETRAASAPRDPRPGNSVVDRIDLPSQRPAPDGTREPPGPQPGPPPARGSYSDALRSPPRQSRPGGSSQLSLRLPAGSPPKERAETAQTGRAPARAAAAATATNLLEGDMDLDGRAAAEREVQRARV